MTHPSPLHVPAKPHIHWASYIIAAAGVVVCLIGGTFAVVSGAGDPTAAGEPSPSPSPVVVYVTRPAAAAAPSTTTKPPPPPAPTIDDGTWTVGTDIPAGRYRATANVSSDCYWAILKTGTNGEDIINNDLPGGGRPQVTLRVGQDFQTRRCGTWQKVG